jgi:hypothetical protein
MAQSGKAPRISYGLRTDAAPEAESVALRNVYRYIIGRGKSKAAGPRQAGDLNDAKGSRHDSRQLEYT